MNTTWGQIVGSTDRFAIEFRLLQDPDASGSVDPDEQASWGSIQLWANGRNLMVHDESGERLQGCHWYLLPLCEWLVANWNPLLHEERLPGPDVLDAATAIEGMSEQRLLPASREDELDEQLRSWWRRHNLSVGAMGSLMPSTFLRRWGDLIEISMSARRRPGVPEHIRFAGHLVERVPVQAVASALIDVLRGLSYELGRRLPESSRVAELRHAIDQLGSDQNQRARQQILLGPAANYEDVTTAESDLSEREVAVVDTPAAALLFGSVAPTVTGEDVQALLGLLRGEGGTAVTLDDERLPDVASVAGLEPGPAGSSLGEETWLAIADPQSVPVDIRGILKDLGVRLEAVDLSDRSVRSICALQHGNAVIAVNRRYRSGDAETVKRFSLAHELCHLLFDRGRAVSLAIASGPWAPLDLERRANAFAAAFLMPQRLVQDVLAEAEDHQSRELAETVANGLNVPFMSAVDRLRNLGVLTYAEADDLKGLGR